MKTPKRVIVALALSLGLAGTAHASPERPAVSPLATFATCAGRLSALMEHQWLLGEDAEETARRRSAMLDLIEATWQHEVPGATLLNWRIEAKAAFARLLTRQSFGRDDADVRRAGIALRRHLAECQALVLG